MESEPDIHDIIDRLRSCLADLDRLVAPVAAAHLDTCLHALADQFISDASPPDK
jgi:DNA-binding FrmR family transcriptional regulator